MMNLTRALAAVSLCAGLARAQPTYMYTSIPLPSGGVVSRAFGVNNLGQIVGRVRVGTSDWRAFLYDLATGVQTDIGPLNGGMPAGFPAGAFSINDGGEVVGVFQHSPTGRPHAFWWHGGAMIDITGPIPNTTFTNGIASAINITGQIVGLNTFKCPTATQADDGALWSSASVLPIPAFPSYQCGFSGLTMEGINDSGAMVGRVRIKVDSLEWFRPAIVVSGVQTMLPTWDGTLKGHGTIHDINSAGIACGSSEDRSTSSATSNAAYWIGSSIFKLNGLATSGVNDDAWGINDSGNIVGNSFKSNFFRAVIWPALSPAATDLKDLLVNPPTATLAYAEEISNAGYIVGATVSGGLEHAYVLAPCTPTFLSAPASIATTPGSTAVFSVLAAGAGPLTYHWRLGGVPLTDGPTASGSIISGAATATLTISQLSQADDGSYDVAVTTACGSGNSPPATLTVHCPADFNNSGFVDTDDFTDFVLAFINGDQDADFDGSGFVDTDDFTSFVLAFEAGC